MNQRTRLSLSRRKKTKITGEEVMNTEFLSSEKNSETVVSLTNGISSETKRSLSETQDSQTDEKNQFSGISPESSEPDYTDNDNGKSGKKSIVTWFKKPFSLKSVSCPVCGKHVILSKINHHLDSNCKLHIHEGVHVDANGKAEELTRVRSCSPRKSECTENRALGSSLQRDEKGKIPDETECDKPNVNRPESGDTNVAPLGDSSILKPTNLGPDFAPTRKKSKWMVRKKENRATVDEGYSVIHVPNVCDTGLQKDSVSQESHDTNVTTMEEKNVSQSILQINEVNKHKPTEELNKSSEEEVSENSKDEEYSNHEPYYLANFKLVLNNVLSNKHDRQLFNEADNDIIDKFNEMSSEEQKLYIRLFQRKHGWFRCSKLEYPRISNNLTPVLKSLVEKGFLEDENHLTNLRETLNLIAAPELKLLVKSLHISSKSAGQKGGTKEDTIQTIVSHAENQKTLFGSFKGVVLKRAKQALGCCVRLSADPKDVFSRLLLLFTMNVVPDDEDSSNNGQAQQLSMLFLANIGKVVYPAYVIDRPTPVFHSRDSLIIFTEAHQQKHEMLMALENNNFEQAYSYYPKAAKKFNDILAKLKDGSEISTALLPEHLRCFTAEWAITKMCYYGVEVLQKWRQYDDAVNQLEILLQQGVFCFDSCGRWYDRLALNLHQHLKQPEKAMEVIRKGLSDPNVRFGRRLALIQRAKRILSSAAFTKGKKRKCDDYADLELKEPNPSKNITISGTRCAELGVFIAPEIDQDGQVIDGTTTFCAVEEYALSYYRQQGFDQGIHGEGSTFSSLYSLFMWDIIFASGIPDVFRSPFQAAPLDFFYDLFYENRKEMIDKRLEEILVTPAEDLQEILSKAWNDNEGQVCAGISWNRFTSVEQAKQLVACLGGQVLSGIFTRFAQGYRYNRAGMPDLVVWNSATLDYMIAEVKGPGDKLSTKQQIWLDDLQSLGAHVEVCYVTDIGAKRLKVSK